MARQLLTEGTIEGIDSSPFEGVSTQFASSRFPVYLEKIAFWSLDARTYTLLVGGVAMAVVTAEAGSEAQFADLHIPLASSLSVTIRPDSPARIRFSSGEEYAIAAAGVRFGIWTAIPPYLLSWRVTVSFETTDTWTPAYEQTSPVVRVAAAYVVTGLLDEWFLQSRLPVAETPLSQWLMDEVGYLKPPAEVIVAVPSSGRGWPR